MRLDMFMLADAASAPPDGKLYIHGGGFTKLTVPAVPFMVQMSVVARLQFEPSDVGRPHSFELKITDPEGSAVMPDLRLDTTLEDEGKSPEGEERFVQLVLNLGGVAFSRLGAHAFELFVDDESARRMTVPVVQLEAPLPQQPQGPSNRAERRRQEREQRKRETGA